MGNPQDIPKQMINLLFPLFWVFFSPWENEFGEQQGSCGYGPWWHCLSPASPSPGGGAVMVAVPLLPARWLCPQLRAGLAGPCGGSICPISQRVPAPTQLWGDGLRALADKNHHLPAEEPPCTPAPTHPDAGWLLGVLALTKLPRRLLLRLPPTPARLRQRASNPRMPPTQSPSSTTCKQHRDPCSG